MGRIGTEMNVGAHGSLSAGVGATIRVAEEALRAGDSGRAIELLTKARTQDPGNKYIDAIIERAKEIHDRSRRSAVQVNKHAGVREERPAPAPAARAVDRAKELGVETATPATTDPQSLPHAIERLTDTAEKYLSAGAPAKAFDALLEAYMLDPVNPLVLACEKTIIPAWEQHCARARDQALEEAAGATEPPEENAPEIPPGMISKLTPAEAARLKVLLGQQQNRRREWERANSTYGPEMGNSAEQRAA